MYQTDFDGFIRKDGCLFAEIVTQVEKKTKKYLTNNQIEGLIEKLHKRGVVSDEGDKSKEGMFVWDHEAIGNGALEELGVRDLRVAYVGRIYMPWEEAKGRTSFGKREGDFVILQIKTKSGAGHFRGLNHDPWRPARDMDDLKSIRYYKFVSR